jgi:addiction module HigA family antidote
MSRSLITIERLNMGRSAIHPGEHLAEQIEALGMSAAELARQIGVPTNRVTSILNGQRAVTGDTALRLGHFFGNSAQFWLNLQLLYDLRTAEKKAGREIRSLPRLTSSRRKTPGHHVSPA